jgi:ribosomal protein S14
MTQPRDRWHEMNQTCDRCGPAVRAIYRVRRNGELYLCRHCANQLWPALSAQGWAIWLIDEYALAPQAT